MSARPTGAARRLVSVSACLLLLAPVAWLAATSPQAASRAQAPIATSPAPLRPLVDANAPVRSCESLLEVTIPDTVVERATVDPGTGDVPASCRVTAIATHPPAGDRITIWIALPMTGWNGRFLGVGGGGFSGGSPNALATPLAGGFAAGATDTGHEGGRGSFALDDDGRLDWQLIRDNAYLGIHRMTITGKALVREFYGAPPARSYFNGCSTGGRQGLMSAQRYPGDYDGIMAGAPAINWAKLHVEQMWGHLAMREAGTVVPECKYTRATEAAIAACDGIDGVTDGIIDDPRRCDYDPQALVGTATDCGTFSDADATVIRRIWDGPRRGDGSFLWYGLPRGASFMGLSGTGGTPPEGRPNRITLDWWQYFLKQDPDWDWTTLTPESFEQAWDQSYEQYNAVIGTDNPDLRAFRDRGGKIVMWHGQVDPLIYPGGSIDYYERVRGEMGGADATAAFFRFYLAPGVGHCAGGPGPQPTGQLGAVIRWVEEGAAPDTLTAVGRDGTGVVTRTRPLCAYPLAARYDGTGDVDDAANYTCAD